MRDPAIPFVRGIACLAVVFGHQIMNYMGSYGYQIGSPLFLLASGYCIHSNYKDRATLPLFGFVFGRVKKLYAHYVLFITFMVIINRDLMQYLLHLLFLQNIKTCADMQWLWTIAIIVQLYFLYPLIRNVPIKVLLPCAAVIEIGYRILVQFDQVGLQALPLGYVFSWSLGIALASKQNEPSWGLNLVASLILGFICVKVGAAAIQYTLATIAGYFMLYKVIKLPRSYFNNFVSYVGNLSYPIYLWHMPVIYAVFVATNGSLWSFPIGIGLSILVGFLMNELVSKRKIEFRSIHKLECAG